MSKQAAHRMCACPLSFVLHTYEYGRFHASWVGEFCHAMSCHALPLPRCGSSVHVNADMGDTVVYHFAKMRKKHPAVGQVTHAGSKGRESHHGGETSSIRFSCLIGEEQAGFVDAGLGYDYMVSFTTTIQGGLLGIWRWRKLGGWSL